jgi:hypothetical protein
MKSLSELLRKIAYRIADFAKFNLDGTVEVTIENVPNDVWRKFSDAMKHLGYDYRGAEDAKHLAQKSSKGKETVVFDEEHAKAFSAAVGKKDLFKPQSSKRIMERAVKEFGITENPSTAGYIIPDGRMLNFGEYGTRSKDHREIGVLFPDDTHGTKAIEAFGNLGAIRLLFSSRSIGIDIYKRPTSAQYDTIENLLYRHNKEGYPVYIDMPGHHREFESPEPGEIMDYIKGKVN